MTLAHVEVTVVKYMRIVVQLIFSNYYDLLACSRSYQHDIFVVVIFGSAE